MDGDEDKIAEFLRRLSARARNRGDRPGCPDEENLAIFLSGPLNENARNILEAHLANCSHCVEDLAAARASEQGYDTAPHRLIQQAMALVEPKERLFDLAVRLARGALELISTTGRIIPIPVPVMRAETTAVAANAVQVEHDVGRFRIVVELEIGDPGTCRVTANVTEPTGAPAEGVRLSLNSADREHASFLTRAGIVVFDRIAAGEYSIAVSESGTHVGRIKLSLTM
jgi:hypothetical protein